jgi:hypothetical protein
MNKINIYYAAIWRITAHLAIVDYKDCFNEISPKKAAKVRSKLNAHLHTLTDMYNRLKNDVLPLNPYADIPHTVTRSEIAAYVASLTRSGLINWLSWNDKNGIYSDVASIAEFGKPCTREALREMMIEQLCNNNGL